MCCQVKWTKISFQLVIPWRVLWSMAMNILWFSSPLVQDQWVYRILLTISAKDNIKQQSCLLQVTAWVSQLRNEPALPPETVSLQSVSFKFGKFIINLFVSTNWWHSEVCEQCWATLLGKKNNAFSKFGHQVLPWSTYAGRIAPTSISARLASRTYVLWLSVWQTGYANRNNLRMSSEASRNGEGNQRQNSERRHRKRRWWSFVQRNYLKSERDFL